MIYDKIRGSFYTFFQDEALESLCSLRDPKKPQKLLCNVLKIGPKIGPDRSVEPSIGHVSDPIEASNRMVD